MALTLWYAQDLSDTVRRAASALRAMTADEARLRRAPDKWSAQETIGHLIDSASNNHQRFVRARDREDLRFPGYDQVAWVSSQNYQDAPWLEVIDLWESFNLHLARIMDGLPESIRLRPRSDHNLDTIAWETVPADEAVTLEYFMRDYIGHLKHHLRQIDAGLASEPETQRPQGSGVKPSRTD